MPSWAVAKGPTLVPLEKRLAMKTEDHPLDYRTFEGVIPAGNYGAGEVIVWDAGTYALAEGDDPVAEIAKGKLKFVLAGKKLRGLFTLVKIKPREGEHGEPWLLFKDHDEFEDAAWKVEEHAESVKTGKTLAQLQAVAQGRADLEEQPRRVRRRHRGQARRARKAAKAEPLPREVKPMLTTLVEAPFDDPRWLFEVKWDGYRAIATIEHDARHADLAQGQRHAAAVPRAGEPRDRVPLAAGRRGRRAVRARRERPARFPSAAAAREAAARPPAPQALAGDVRRVRPALRRRARSARETARGAQGPAGAHHRARARGDVLQARARARARSCSRSPSGAGWKASSARCAPRPTARSARASG